MRHIVSTTTSGGLFTYIVWPIYRQGVLRYYKAIVRAASVLSKKLIVQLFIIQYVR